MRCGLAIIVIGAGPVYGIPARYTCPEASDKTFAVSAYIMLG